MGSIIQNSGKNKVSPVLPKYNGAAEKQNVNRSERGTEKFACQNLQFARSKRENIWFQSFNS
jgi:hypothetical protein